DHLRDAPSRGVEQLRPGRAADQIPVHGPVAQRDPAFLFAPGPVERAGFLKSHGDLPLHARHVPGRAAFDRDPSSAQQVCGAGYCGAHKHEFAVAHATLRLMAPNACPGTETGNIAVISGPNSSRSSRLIPARIPAAMAMSPLLAAFMAISTRAPRARSACSILMG